MSLICSDSALRALHRVMVCTRFQASENADTEAIAEAMDVAEYLVAVLQNHEELAEEEGLERFRLYLQDLEVRLPGYSGLTAAFEADASALVEKQALPA